MTEERWRSSTRLKSIVSMRCSLKRMPNPRSRSSSPCEIELAHQTKKAEIGENGAGVRINIERRAGQPVKVTDKWQLD